LPLPERSGGYFLLRYSTLEDSFLLGSRMLCVARTFLIRRSASDRPTNCFYPAKIRFLCQRTQKLVEFLCKGGLFPYLLRTISVRSPYPVRIFSVVSPYLLHSYRYGPDTDLARTGCGVDNLR
ncbi:MAG TPA: hypothetical protein DHV19_03470, partial [Bacteroides cellulosilyticus]|nr:hypothetical protein [Bacteroides cellulosilyticus]